MFEYIVYEYDPYDDVYYMYDDWSGDELGYMYWHDYYGWVERWYE